jgi:hypothetical protein
MREGVYVRACSRRAYLRNGSGREDAKNESSPKLAKGVSKT